VKKTANPLYRITLEEAKARGFYKGPIPKGPQTGKAVVKKVFSRVRGYSYLKKIKGRKRRVRFFVRGYVKEISYLFRVPVRFKRRIGKVSQWIPVRALMDKLKRQYDVSSIDLIYRRNLKTDVASPIDSFVWKKPIRVKPGGTPGQPIYDIKGPAFLRGRPLFRSCRVWFLLYHVPEEEFMIGSRSALFPYEVRGYKEAYKEVVKVREAVLDYYDDAKYDEYFEMQGFVAFTLYFSGERMPNK